MLNVFYTVQYRTYSSLVMMNYRFPYELVYIKNFFFLFWWTIRYLNLKEHFYYDSYLIKVMILLFYIKILSPIYTFVIVMIVHHRYVVRTYAHKQVIDLEHICYLILITLIPDLYCLNTCLYKCSTYTAGNVYNKCLRLDRIQVVPHYLNFVFFQFFFRGFRIF